MSWKITGDCYIKERDKTILAFDKECPYSIHKCRIDGKEYDAEPIINIHRGLILKGKHSLVGKTVESIE